MKELADIKNNGTPEGIAVLSVDRMDEWTFTIRVLGDETVYKVCTACARMLGVVLVLRAPMPDARGLWTQR